MTIAKARFQFRERYFFLLILPLAVIIEWAFAVTHDWLAYPRSEWVVLFDLCLFVPLLYFICFSSSLEMRARLIRTAGIVGMGLFAARFIVPEANQFVIADLAHLRNLMLVCVLAFEGWVFFKVIQAVYRRNADAAALERDFAMPAWIAKLMVLEARFWKAVWAFVRGK